MDGARYSIFTLNPLLRYKGAPFQFFVLNAKEFVFRDEGEVFHITYN